VISVDYRNKARRARLRLIGIGVVVVAAAAAGVTVAVTSMSGGGSKAAPSHDATPSQPAPSANGPAGAGEYTPATAPKVHLLKPRSSKGGVGVGFEHSGLGATSAAVTYWQDLDILDDRIARRQWTAITSKDSPHTTDNAVSDVRTLREGSGLPPSGGTPAGLSFTTVVNATLARTLDDTGDVIDVWMTYDRYATVPGKEDDAPLKDQLTDLIVKWEDGDWKVTEETQYTKKKTGHRAYDPNSKWSFMDGWRGVVTDG
jgi:hypothetical protein